MTYDVLRGLLGDLATEAPVEMRRSEQVWARYRRTRRRRLGAVAAATALALVAVVVVTRPAGDRDAHLVPTRPTPTASTSSAPDRAARMPVPSGAAREASPSGDAHVLPPDRPGGTPSPPARKPYQWPAGLLAFAQPPHINPNGTTTVYAMPYAGDNAPDGYVVDFGDGSPLLEQSGTPCNMVEGRVYAGGFGPGWVHRYTKAGAYVVTISVTFAGCGRPSQTATTTTTVLVDDAFTGVQGTGENHSVMGQTPVRSAEAPHRVAVSVDIKVPDSYAAFVVVEWGDGTVRLLRSHVPDSCGSMAPALDPDWPMYVEHTYPKTGTYWSALVMFTATCQGGPGNAMSATLYLKA